MKILVNSRIYQEKYSGIQNYIFNLYSRIQKIDTKNTYTFLQTEDHKTLGETQISKTFKGNIGKAFFDWILIIFSLRKFDGKILHGPSFTLPIIKPRGYKYAVTIHDLAFLIYPLQYTWLFRTYLYWTIYNSVKKADCIICISESTKNDLLRFYPFVIRENIHVVPLGVSDDFFIPSSTERIIKERYFFSLTTHPKRKNILRVLDILGENKNTLQEYKYVIAGIFGGESLRILKEKIEQYGLQNMVILYGYADKEVVKNLYSNAELLIYPSYYEGFGLPILEAMAAGCPVISSNTSSLPEVNPRSECMFDPNDNADIFAKMQYILSLSEEEKTQMIEKNREFARGLNWENTAEKTRDIFNSLA